MYLRVLIIIVVAMLTACTKTTGDTKIKNFHITEISLGENFAKGCKFGCSQASARKMPAELKTKLTNGLYHYAAAYNQLQAGAQSAYRLEVTLITLSYENCSASARVLDTISGGIVDSGGSIVVSESKLIDITTGSVIREFTNHNQKVNLLTCTKTSQNDSYSKQMSKYILRRANLLKSTPKSVEKKLAGVDVLQPRQQPISPLSVSVVN